MCSCTARVQPNVGVPTPANEFRISGRWFAAPPDSPLGVEHTGSGRGIQHRNRGTAAIVAYSSVCVDLESGYASPHRLVESAAEIRSRAELGDSTTIRMRLPPGNAWIASTDRPWEFYTQHCRDNEQLQIDSVAFEDGSNWNRASGTRSRSAKRSWSLQPYSTFTIPADAPAAETRYSPHRASVSPSSSPQLNGRRAPPSRDGKPTG